MGIKLVGCPKETRKEVYETIDYINTLGLTGKIKMVKFYTKPKREKTINHGKNKEGTEEFSTKKYPKTFHTEVFLVDGRESHQSITGESSYKDGVLYGFLRANSKKIKKDPLHSLMVGAAGLSMKTMDEFLDAIQSPRKISENTIEIKTEGDARELTQERVSPLTTDHKEYTRKFTTTEVKTIKTLEDWDLWKNRNPITNVEYFGETYPAKFLSPPDLSELKKITFEGKPVTKIITHRKVRTKEDLLKWMEQSPSISVCLRMGSGWGGFFKAKELSFNRPIEEYFTMSLNGDYRSVKEQWVRV